MKRNVSDLLAHYCDEDLKTTEIPLSSSRIKELTMEKIMETKKKPSRRRFRLHGIGLAAVLAAILAVTAAAATLVIHYINVQKVAEGEVIAYHNSETGEKYEYPQADTVVTVDEIGEGAKEVCFQAAYLPDGTGELDQNGIFSVKLESFAQEEGVDYEDLLQESGLTQDEAEQWRFTLWGKNADPFFRIDLYTGAQLDGADLVFEGEASIEKECELNRMEAHYVRAEVSFNDIGYQNHILLYSKELSCLVDIYGEYDFDELEKIAQGITLRQTRLGARDTFNGHFTVIGGGVG